MEGLHFEITADNSNFTRKLQEVENGVRQTSRQIEQSGMSIEELFGRMTRAAVNVSTSAHSFNELEAAIRKAGAQIKDMDFGTVQEKIGALSYMIQKNEAVIAENVSMLEKWKQDAETAFASGDTGTLDAITRDIDEQIAKIKQLTQETEGYRSTLQAVMEISGMGSQEVSVPRLYDSEEDMQHVEELRKKIVETSAEIARVGAEGGDTSALVVSLSGMKDELNGCETSAAQAAAALGEDLGGRAAEAQQSLHSLNTAIDEQQEKINTITAALEEARANYEALQQSESATSDEVERAAATYDTLSETLRNAQSEMIALQTSQQTAQSQWNNVSEEIRTQDSIMVKMLGGYENYKSILGQLPQPVQSVIGGIQGMTGAAKAFIATPLGAIIAAIVLALQAMKTWLTSSVEGQMKFAEISGYVSGVLGQLKEIVITVGKAIFKAFSDPKQAISDFWEALKTNVVNRFKSVGVIAASLGKVIKAAFTLDMDGVKSGIKELMNGFLQLGTGVENVTDKVSAWAKGVHNAAAETATIARESKELEIEVSKWQKRNQELEKVKAEARGKMYNTSLSTSERRKAQKDFEAALQEQYEAEAKFADKRIELQERTMALTTNGIEDENKLRDLQAARLAVDTNRAQQLASLQRRAGALNNTDNSYAQKREEALVSLGQMEAQLILDNEKRKLELMDEGHEKRMEQIAQQGDEELAAIEKLKQKMVKANKEAGVTDVNANGLTTKQQGEIDLAAQYAAEMKAKAEKDWLEAEAEAMRDYLKEYGTFQEQKLAIAEEYAEKIKKATTEGEKLSLQKEQEQAEQAVEVNAIMSHIDWYQVFGNVGGIMKESLSSLLDNLKDFVNTDKFQNLGAEQQERIVDAMSKIREQIGSNADLGWRDLAADMTAYQTALQEATQATEDYNALEAELMPKIKDAQRRLEQAKQDPNANPGDVEALGEEVKNLMQQLSEGGLKVTNANSKVTSSGQKLAQTTEAVTQPIDDIHNFLESTGLSELQSLWDSFNKLKGGIDGLKALSEAGKASKEIGKGAKEMGKSLADAGKEATETLANGLSKAGLIGQIIGAILKIFDVLKDGIGPVISGLIDSILGAVSGIIKNILSGKLFEQIGSSLVEGIGGILNAITLGGFNSWFGLSDNAKEVQEMTDRLTNSNEALQHSIDKLKDSIDKSYGGKALTDYQKALEAQKAQDENMRKILDTQMHEWEGGWHGHKSNAHKWDMGDDYTRLVNQLLGTNLRGGEWGDWAKLTAVQMEKIRTYLPEVWSSMLDQGHFDKSDYFEQYADQAGKIEELTAQIKENLMDTTFEGLRDSFIDQLMDMERSAEDFGDDFSEMMQKALLRAAIGNSFDERIREWYDDVTAAMVDENGLYRELTEGQINDFRTGWDNMVNDMIRERDRLAGLTGYTGESESGSERTATAKGIATASQDSVDELNGRFTTIQAHTFAISENMVKLAELQQMHLPLLQNLSYLAPIEENTYYCRRLDGMDTDLHAMRQTMDDIERHLRNNL